MEDGKKSKMDEIDQKLKPMGLLEGSSRQGSVLVLQHSGLLLTENIHLTKIKPVIYVFCLSHLYENM